MSSDDNALGEFLRARRELLDCFDHANLNTLEPFRDLVPTTENLCIEIWRIFTQFAHEGHYPQVKLQRVHVAETENNSFEYFGGDETG